MASTSIDILRDTLRRLTHDPRVGPDDPLLMMVKQQINDFEANQSRLEDDKRTSFVPIFVMLDKHPHGEAAAEEYLKQKRLRREREKQVTIQQQETFEREYVEKVNILLMRLKSARADAWRSSYNPPSYQRVASLEREITSAISDWNQRVGTRCEGCSQIKLMHVGTGTSECQIDVHSYWDSGTDSGSGFGGEPPKFHPCTQGQRHRQI